MPNTPPIIPSVPPVTTGPSGVASQQNPPPQPQLPPGTVVQGSVIGLDAKGNPVIQTQNLQLVLGTKFPLDKGAQVSVRIDPPLTRESTPSFRILSINGRPPAMLTAGLPETTATTLPVAARPEAPASGQAKPVGVLLEVLSRPAQGEGAARGAPADAPAPHVPARGTAAEVTLSAGEKIMAVLLRPSVSAQAVNALNQLAAQVAFPLPSNPANALRPGLQLQVQVVQMTAPVAVPSSPAAISAEGLPQNPPVPNHPLSAQWRSGYAQYAKQAPAMMPGSSSLPGAAPTQNPPSVSPPAQGMPPAQPTVPPQPSMQVNISASLTPQVMGQLLARTEAQALPQGHIAAVVMGKEPGGAAIVQTRFGMFTLPQVQAGSAQPGSVLVLRVNAIEMPPQHAAPSLLAGSGGMVASAVQLTSEWSALHELSSLLQGMHSTMAAQTLQRMVPHIGGSFSAGLLFFMTMLRKGDLTEWMGRDMVEHLERMGKGELIQRLGADMATVRNLFAEQPQGNWQALFFPVMVDRQLEHARLFLKPEEPNKKDGSRGTRFIVELDLSNLGPMQMDGLVKKRTEKTRFDLVIRTMAELPEPVRADIYGIFTNAQEVTGLDGGLTFRVVQEFPVHPLQEIEQQNDGGEGSILA